MTISSQDKTVSSQERTISSQEKTVSSQPKAISFKENAVSSQPKAISFIRSRIFKTHGDGYTHCFLQNKKYRFLFFYCFCFSSTDATEKDDVIILSDTWYEFTVFWKKFHISRATANSWLQKGWLAYSEVGKMRFINKTDIEGMMIHFRRRSIWTPLIFMLADNASDVLLCAVA